MSSRMLLNLALLAAVAVLALVAWFEPGKERPAEPPPITALDKDQVQRIRIERRDKDTVILIRDGGHWRMERPIRAPAAEFRVDAILRLARETSHARFPVADGELAKFKLEKPMVRLFLDQVEIDFGTTEPIDGRRYVRVGDTVHLITDAYYYHHLTADAPDLVSTRLLPPDARPVEIVLPGLVLQRGDDDTWKLTPERDDVSADDIHALVDEWRRARALWVERDEGDGEPQGRIRVRIEGSEAPIEFQITGREPDLVLTRKDLGLRYRVAADVAGRLLDLPKPEKKGAAAPDPAGKDGPPDTGKAERPE